MAACMQQCPHDDKVWGSRADPGQRMQPRLASWGISARPAWFLAPEIERCLVVQCLQRCLQLTSAQSSAPPAPARWRKEDAASCAPLCKLRCGKLAVHAQTFCQPLASHKQCKLDHTCHHTAGRLQLARLEASAASAGSQVQAICRLQPSRVLHTVQLCFSGKTEACLQRCAHQH